MQRKAWEDDGSSFVTEIQRLLALNTNADGFFVGAGKELFVRSVRDNMGQSEGLFAKFCGFCIRSYDVDVAKGRGIASDWPSVLLDLVRSLSASTGEQLKRYRKLAELAMILDSIRRQGFLDQSRLLQVFRSLRVLMMGQAAGLDRDIVIRRNRMQSQRDQITGNSRSSDTKKKKAVVSKPAASRNISKGARSPALQELEANQYARMSGPMVRLILRDGWKEVTMLDQHRVFTDRVTDDIAPGYSQTITRPMDLSFILRRLGQSDADGYSLIDMDLDMQLMFTNCLRYNGPESMYSNYARRMRREWAQVRTRLLKRITNDAGESKTDPNTITEATRKLPKEIFRAILRRAWEALSKEDVNQFFAEPVTDDVAPNYSVEIARPMDLSTMLRTLEAGQYSSLEQFNDDVCLIFDNCVQYNGPTSVYGKIAGKVQKWWISQRRQLEKDVITAAQQYNEPLSTQILSSTTTSADEAAHSSKPILEKIQLEDALKKLLGHLTSGDEQGVFAFPVRVLINLYDIN